MLPFTPKHTRRDGPEGLIQTRIINRLESFDWYIKVIIGNALQHGLPDLFVAHARWGQKWVEVKNPASFSFTERQQQNFPKMHAAGVGVWVLFDDRDDELLKLTKPANWFEIMFAWQYNGVNKRPEYLLKV